MTAQELIDELKEYPPDTLVVKSRLGSKTYDEYWGVGSIDLRHRREDDNIGKFAGDYLQTFSHVPDSFEAILIG